PLRSHFLRPGAFQRQSLTGILPLLLEDASLMAQHRQPIIKFRLPPGQLSGNELCFLRCKAILRLFPLACGSGDLVQSSIKVALDLLAALLEMCPLGQDTFSLDRCPPPIPRPPAPALLRLGKRLHGPALGISKRLFLLDSLGLTVELS